MCLGDGVKKGSSLSMAEMKRKQTTSIILMGVIGAEFGQEMEPARRKEEASLWSSQNENGDVGKQVQDGFGIAQGLARQTSEFFPRRTTAHVSLTRPFAVWEFVVFAVVLHGPICLCSSSTVVPSARAAVAGLAPVLGAATVRRGPHRTWLLGVGAAPGRFQGPPGTSGTLCC